MCNCKSSIPKTTTVKQVVKKVKTTKTTSNTNTPKRTVSRKVSYRRPI